MRKAFGPRQRRASLRRLRLRDVEEEDARHSITGGRAAGNPESGEKEERQSLLRRGQLRHRGLGKVLRPAMTTSRASVRHVRRFFLVFFSFS